MKHLENLSELRLPKERYLLPLLSMIVLVCGLFTDVTQDAGKYAAISKEMLQNGHWLEVKVQGLPYLQKPPFVFWISALSFYLFGFSNFAYKLPSFLFALLGVFSTYRLALLFYPRLVAQIAGWFLFCSLGFFYYNNDMHTDTTLMGLVVTAIWQITAFIKGGKWWNFLLGFTAVGLAMITKGPIGAAIPAFAIGMDFLVKRNWKGLFRWEWILGLLIAGIITTPVLWGLYQQFGPKGIEFYFWTNNVGRITGTYVSNEKDYFFYVHSLLWLSLPWSFLIFSGIFFELRQYYRNKFKIPLEEDGVTLPGALLFFLILTVASAKSPHYVLVVLPLFCIVGAKWIAPLIGDDGSDISKWNRTLLRIHFWLNGLIWIIIILLVTVTLPLTSILLWGILLAMLGFSIYYAQGRQGYFKRLLVPSSISLIALFFVLNTHFFPFIFKYHSGIVAAHLANELAKDDEPLYMYKRNYFETNFYSDRPFKAIEDFGALVGVLHEKKGWILTTQEGYDEIKAIGFGIEQVIELEHFYLGRPDPRFFLPATRPITLEKRYFLKL